jgi:hypothetical protein
LIVLLRLLQFCSASTVRLREPMFFWGDRNRLFNDEMTGALLNRLPWPVDRNKAFC